MQWCLSRVAVSQCQNSGGRVARERIGLSRKRRGGSDAENRMRRLGGGSRSG